MVHAIEWMDRDNAIERYDVLGLKLMILLGGKIGQN